MVDNDKDVRFVQAQSLILVEEKDKRFIVGAEESIKSGDVIKIQHTQSKNYLFSYQQNYQESHSSQEQKVFTLDKPDFEDNLFIIYKVHSAEIDEDYIKNLKQSEPNPIQSGDEIILLHKGTQRILYNNQQYKAPISQDCKEVCMISPSKINQNNYSYLQMVFIIVDVDQSFYLENNSQVNILPKLQNQVLFSSNEFINEKLQQYEVGLRSVNEKQSLNGNDTFKIHFVEQEFNQTKVPMQIPVKQGEKLIFKHVRSGCILGYQNQAISKFHKEAVLLVKNSFDYDTDGWEIRLDFVNENNLDQKETHIRNKDIVSIKNLEKGKLLVSNNDHYNNITNTQKIDLEPELSIEQNDNLFQIIINPKNDKLSYGTMFKLQHFQTNKYLSCSKVLIEKDESSIKFDNTNPELPQYCFEVNCVDGNSDNNLFQVIDIKDFQKI